MNRYLCKCGRAVNKSTNADNTGNRETEGCEGCPYLMPWGPTEWDHTRHAMVTDVKGYECRMSPTLEYRTELRGHLDDKTTIRITSLDFDFLERVSDWVKEHYPNGELSGGFSRDRIRPAEYVDEGRYRYTLACSQNKKGIAAKRALWAEFFDETFHRKDMDADAEKQKILRDIEQGKAAAHKDAAATDKETNTMLIYRDPATGWLYRVSPQPGQDDCFCIEYLDPASSAAWKFWPAEAKTRATSRKTIVSDPSGRKGGQQLLNEFVEQLALDLPRFMNMNDREKADTLLKIIGVGDRLAAFDREIRALYDRRTTIGQIAEQKKHFAEEQVEYHDAPDEPVSVSELIRSQQEILARNGENQRKRERAAQLAQHVKDLQERVDSLAAQLQQASEQCANAMKDLETAQKSAEDLQDESTAELEASIRDAEEINRKVRANLDKARAEDEARSYAEQYKALTDSIDAKRQERRALLDGADLPLPGLSVDDGALTYQGKRWGDMSGSDQLRVATAIVRKLNPECGFVLLDKLEQMDLRTLTDFGSWLASEGLQAIATRVSTGGECQIIIEDRICSGDGGPGAQREPRPGPRASRRTAGTGRR